MTQSAPPRKFAGFVRPEKNYFPMPNEWIDICAEIDNLAEIKVIQYVLRHTWGYQEYGIAKAITVDEFMHGRKRTDGTRMDKGTGLKSDRSVKDGVKDAIEHGYLVCEIDATDKARIVKSYALRTASGIRGVVSTPLTDENRQVVSTPLAGSIYPPEGYNLPLDQVVSTPRSEKDTIERHYKKDTIEKHEREEVATATARSQPSSQKEVVDGHTHQHPVVDNDIPANSHQPKPSQPVLRQDTNKVTHPPAPRKPPSNKTIPEPELTPDEQAVFDAWCSLFKVAVPLIPANAKACKQLAKPLQVWTGILHESTAQVLKRIMNWAYKNDKNGYYKRGFKLYDAAREFEGWQSAQERPQGNKEESNEHKATQPANAFIERCLDKDYNKRKLEEMRAKNALKRQAQAEGV